MKPFWMGSSKSVMFLALVLLMVLMSPVFALEYTVGVKAGDWVKYGDISISWNGTGTEPQFITDMKQMDWSKMEVQSVSGTTINMTTTVHYKNGTDKPQTASYDVKSGQGMTGFPFVIAANLKKGDPITTQLYVPTLNDTVTRRYAGASRSVNVLDLTPTSGGYTAEFTVYWDQETGVLLEFFMRYPDYTTGAYMEQSIKATETNMWSADFLGMVLGNLLYIMITVVAIVVIIVGVFIAKRKKKAPILTVIPTPAAPEEAP